MPNKKDWTAWHKERSRFMSRDTEGFSKDLKALEQHIKNLTELSPKDKAGWPQISALTHLDQLKRDCNRFKEYLKLGW